MELREKQIQRAVQQSFDEFKAENPEMELEELAIVVDRIVHYLQLIKIDL